MKLVSLVNSKLKIAAWVILAMVVYVPSSYYIPDTYLLEAVGTEVRRIDSTGAVVAAGAFLGDDAEKVAAVVKMIQNILIGIVAFVVAVFWCLRIERKDDTRPSLLEVWYRFPKFVVGFIVASIVVSIFVEPASGLKAVKAVGGACKTYRNWFFALCFVSIGLETNFKELVSVGGGRPAIAYWISQTANAIWTLFITWILWSSTFFPAVIPPD